ncbi:bifunctional endoribonuclease/protein kinase ire1 [Ascosphaera aggregata]|nr:bifunctional endoribonuclease/protein kinase ire1 [Ascosphaera aggregata]
MRWRLPTGVIALLPIIAVAVQQQQHFSWQSSQQSSQRQVLLGGLRNPHIQRDTNIAPSYSDIISGSDASAIATLAPARGSKAAPAVGAPPARRTSAEGISNSQLNARSLQDWEVEDFVLLATIDGSLHARDRRTGAPLWALEVPTPMVETTYHRENPTRGDLNKNIQPEDDLLWIVEPSRDGDLYVYHQGSDGGLQKLGLTVRALVDNTPYSGLDPPVTYTARKETTLYTVDVRTGAVIRVFSSQGPQAMTNQCLNINIPASTVEDEYGCEPQLGGTITIGRVEYTVAVQNTETGDAICTLKFTEWTPNSRDADLENQYTITMDKRHIYSMHDGIILGLDHGHMNGKRYVQRFPSPVARVFDVARQVSPMSGDELPLVVLSQPLVPPDPDYASDPLEEPYVFINCTEQGGWFAMSEATYPLVTGRSNQAQIYTKDYTTKGRPLMSLSAAQLRAALVGVHKLNNHDGLVPSVSASPRIAGLLTEATKHQPRDEIGEQPNYPDIFETSAILRTTYNNRGDVVIVLLSLVCGLFFWVNKSQMQELLKRSLLLKDLNLTQGPVLSESTSNTSKSPDRKKPHNVAISVASPAAHQHGQESPSPENIVGSAPLTPDNAVRSNHPNSALSNSTNLTTPSPTVRVLPGVSPQSPVSSVVSLSVDPSGAPPPEKPKKKAHRGRRGGQAHKRGKRSQIQSRGLPESDGAHSVKSQSTVVGFSANQGLGEIVQEEIAEPDGGDRVGALKVYEKEVLGRGSHGTVVCKGVFDGRDVAVKRLLSEFYEVASHEVQLLQESDDHSNVIRYFCRERSSKFLYIALELCPANLQQIIERPEDFVDIIDYQKLHQTEMLRQITMGVRHLHSLKIVHRDLKPQNILVAAPKKLRTGAYKPVRLLISDFGLCKRLEDNQSSFRATTANAAGTSGWRAPELLIDEERMASTSPMNASLSSSYNQTRAFSDQAIIDPTTNRRATRAIDIFSLGCVFYYVLTQGGHPFDKDGKFLREANIVKGEYNLDDLQCLGDYAYEAEDLIKAMLHHDPRKRPDASAILVHPFFWSPNDRLNFLCDVSDHFEFEPRDPPSAALSLLESVGDIVMGPDRDFLKKLTPGFRDSLGKQRKYTGSRMLDLLRALRNKRNHYNDMPDNIKAQIGGLPEGYLTYWTTPHVTAENCPRAIGVNILSVLTILRDFLAEFINHDATWKRNIMRHWALRGAGRHASVVNPNLTIAVSNQFKSKATCVLESAKVPLPDSLGGMEFVRKPATTMTFQVMPRSVVKCVPTKSPYFAASASLSKVRKKHVESSVETVAQGPKTGTLKKLRATSYTLSAAINAPEFGLIQERLAHNPFRLLIATIFLNKTRGKVAIPVLYKLFERYPTPVDLAHANIGDIASLMQCLGLQNTRAKKCIALAQKWIEAQPVKGIRYRRLHYPKHGDGLDMKPRETIDEYDKRVAWEAAHLPGVGPYALDSWRIFCRDELRGLAKDWKGTGAANADFVPEWKTVLPLDKELRAYLVWMWLKEGYEWNCLNGEVKPLRKKIKRAIEKGRPIYFNRKGKIKVIKTESEPETSISFHCA